ILHGRDDRLLVIVGPCSIHDTKAALDYARRLQAVAEELREDICVVMRVYFEKPRTTIGWKGLINDPDLNGTFNIRKGMWLARKVLVDIVDIGLPTATEFLDPITPQYISDAISWGAIGARNTESQVHRQLASGLSMPVGFKNSTDGNVKVAADSCYAAANEHHFLSVNVDGSVISAETLGNPDCHVILRGSIHGPNYDVDSVAQALEYLQESNAPYAASHGLIIDASHGNSGKDEVQQARVVRNIAQRLAVGEQGISGIMMESFIQAGNQKAAPLEQLEYGKSVTDRCISWDDTNVLLHELAQAVRSRRGL
ncbi:MAG: 3-deoxy-7-phosphoheptulonate synthase, partial [Alloscardovia omnicolens]|nr:3-deoxy-7-phosphoheptulonate synthase [Alloscardovia omnicolens]